MPDALDALTYIAHPEKHPAPPVCVLFGDETFLKRLSLSALRHDVLGGEDGEFSLARFDGRTIGTREVFDELSTVALFGGGRRLVVVDEADEFVTRYRPELEDYVARPATNGVLALLVSTWPKTTRLFKAVAAGGLQVECKTPAPAAIGRWLSSWAQRTHQAKLDAGAADVLLELVGPELGLLDQELAKLSVSVGPGGLITEDLVQELVGGWRAKTAWDMLDAALAGDARSALAQLDRLLSAGENAVGLLAQMSASMRRFAAATRLIEQAEAAGRRIALRQALEQAGVKPFVLAKAEAQLKQLGRKRAGRLYHTLLAADLDIKGDSRLPPRVVLERLIVGMSSTMGGSASGGSPSVGSASSGMRKRSLPV